MQSDGAESSTLAAANRFPPTTSQAELYKLAEEGGVKPQRVIGLITGIVFYTGTALAFLLPNEDTFLSGLESFEIIVKTIVVTMILFIFIFIFELYRKTDHPFTNIAFTFLGIIYLPFTISKVHYITRAGEDSAFHASIMLCYFLILWANDSGAYFAGKKFGKRKLFERISPGKTWEGSIGGAVLAFTVAHFVSIYNTNLSRLDWVVITIIIIVFGTYGDLVKSMFKRSINRKDSGTILPGHGGFIDRFDGLFLSLPFVFLYLLIKAMYP
jgi:phosphatidate cytidylyltransferase